MGPAPAGARGPRAIRGPTRTRPSTNREEIADEHRAGVGPHRDGRGHTSSRRRTCLSRRRTDSEEGADRHRAGFRRGPSRARTDPEQGADTKPVRHGSASPCEERTWPASGNTGPFGPPVGPRGTRCRSESRSGRSDERSALVRRPLVPVRAVVGGRRATARERSRRGSGWSGVRSVRVARPVGAVTRAGRPGHACGRNSQPIAPGQAGAPWR